MPANDCVAPATLANSDSRFGQLYHGFKKRAKPASQPVKEEPLTHPSVRDPHGLLVEQWQAARLEKAREEFLRTQR